MKKTYLFVYSDSLGRRPEVKRIVDSIPAILTWRYDLPHSFYLVSEESAQTISSEIRRLAGNRGRFIVTQIESNKQGWLPKGSWYIINHHTLMGNEEE